MLNLTADIITKVSAGVITGDRAQQIATLHNEICPKYGIDTPDIFHEFFANELHESACFTVLSENLNYSVEALLTKFGRHRISEADARKYGRAKGQRADQEAIANILYGGAWGTINLGNVVFGDGWELRGSGPIQITGRANITAFAQYFFKLAGMAYTPETMAEKLRTDLSIGIHSACWVFAIAKKLIPAAESDNMKDIVKRINGGFNGMDDRLKYYELCKQYIK